MLSCKKEIPPSTSAFFMKTYQADSATQATYTEQMPDGGFLIIGSEGAGRPVLIRTDKSGNQEWMKIMPEYWFNLNPGISPHWWATKLGPNLFNLQGGLNITNIDTSGNVIQAYQVSSGGTNWFNGPIFQTGSNYVVPYCGGWIGWRDSGNSTLVFDQNLKYLRIDSFHDTRLNGQVLQYFVYGVTGSGAYDICGDKYTRNNWTYDDNAKLFIARIPKKGPVIQTIIDSGNQSIEDYPEFQIKGPDSSEIFLGARTDWNSNNSYPIVIKADNNLNITWKNTFPSAEGSVNEYCISPCNDGGFIICGSMQKTGYTVNYPYALKIDANGNKVWDKVFDTKYNGEFNYAIPTADGGYAFVGYTNAFGEGKNGNRILFVKTDANGNL